MIPVVVLTSSSYVEKSADFHEFVNAVKGLGAFWAVVNEPSPGSVKGDP